MHHHPGSQTTNTMNNMINTPEPIVVEYTMKHGRRDGLLFNNRIHVYGGNGQLNWREKNSEQQYAANRDWILANFPKNKSR